MSAEDEHRRRLAPRLRQVATGLVLQDVDVVALMQIIVNAKLEVVIAGVLVELEPQFGREDAAEFLRGVFSLPRDAVYYKAAYDAEGVVWPAGELTDRIYDWAERLRASGMRVTLL